MISNDFNQLFGQQYTLPIKMATDAIQEEERYTQDISTIFTIVNGIKAGQQVVFREGLDKVTKKHDRAKVTGDSNIIKQYQEVWSPTLMRIWHTEHFMDFQNSYEVWAENNGVKKYMLEGTVFGAYILSLLAPAARRDLMRIALLGDTTADTVRNAGYLTDQVDPNDDADFVADYTQMDGLFKIVFDHVANSVIPRYTIAENAAAAEEDQYNLGATAALDFLNWCDYNPDINIRLRTNPNRVKYLTQSLYDNYAQYLQANDKLESSWMALQNGVSVLRHNGRPVVPLPILDEYIQSDQNNGTTVNLPHRGFMTVPGTIAIGFDANDTKEDVRVWTNDETEYTNWKMIYKADVKVFRPDKYFAVGY